MPKAHRQQFVGKVTAMEGGRVKWAWMDQTGSASRWISVAKSEGAHQVTQEELKIMFVMRWRMCFVLWRRQGSKDMVKLQSCL